MQNIDYIMEEVKDYNRSKYVFEEDYTMADKVKLVSGILFVVALLVAWYFFVFSTWLSRLPV